MKKKRYETLFVPDVHNAKRCQRGSWKKAFTPPDSKRPNKVVGQRVSKNQWKEKWKKHVIAKVFFLTPSHIVDLVAGWCYLRQSWQHGSQWPCSGSEPQKGQLPGCSPRCATDRTSASNLGAIQHCSVSAWDLPKKRQDMTGKWEADRTRGSGYNPIHPAGYGNIFRGPKPWAMVHEDCKPGATDGQSLMASLACSRLGFYLDGSKMARGMVVSRKLKLDN